MKLETHLHTSEVSPCGMVDARTAVRQYAGAGYGGIIVTDHFGSYSLDLFAGTPKEKAEQFFRGYRLAKEEGEQCGIAVLFGAEISLEEGPEDYLLYGITRLSPSSKAYGCMKPCAQTEKKFPFIKCWERSTAAPAFGRTRSLILSTNLSAKI